MCPPISDLDPDNGGYSPGAIAIDSHAALAGDPSIFSSAANVITKGIPLTALSIVNSFANTGIEVANVFGADIAPVKADNELSAMGWDDYKDYYDTHSQGIEAAGLVAGSFIPGLAAVKVLKLAQAGKMTSILQTATNIFAGPRQKIIDNALSEIAEGGIYDQLAGDKIKAIALGFGDQALQALAFETGVATTMKASPLLDQDSFTDTVNNMFYGALTGGVIGGGIEGIVTRGLLNRALVNSDIATKAAESIYRSGVKTGALFNQVSTAGDQVAQIFNSLDKIPTGVAATALGAKKVGLATDAAILDSKKILQQLVSPGDEDVSNAVFDTIYQMHQSGVDKDLAYDILGRLAKISRIDTPASIPTDDAFYINRFSPNKLGNIELSDLVTKAPVPEADLSFRYSLKPFSTEVKVATASDTYTAADGREIPLYATAQDAFDQGADIFVGGTLKTYVNPKAPNLTAQLPRPGESRVLTQAERKAFDKTGSLPQDSAPLFGAPLTLNTKTGAISTSAIPVVGDFGKVEALGKGLSYGDKFSAQTVENGLTQDTPAIDANARYVWAAQRGLKSGDRIQNGGFTSGVQDIPPLEGVMKNEEEFIQWYKNQQGKGNIEDLTPKYAKQLDNDIQELMTNGNDLEKIQALRLRKAIDAGDNTTAVDLIDKLSSSDSLTDTVGLRQILYGHNYAEMHLGGDMGHKYRIYQSYMEGMHEALPNLLKNPDYEMASIPRQMDMLETELASNRHYAMHDGVPLTPLERLINEDQLSMLRRTQASNLDKGKYTPPDIPFLEEMYNGYLRPFISGQGLPNKGQPWQEYITSLSRKGIGFADGSDLPESSTAMLAMIRNAKDDLIHDLISNNPKMSSEEIARRANVPESYLSNNLAALAPKDYMIPASEHTTVNHAQLEYDIGSIKTQDGQILRGLLDSQYRLNVIKDAQVAASAKYFGSQVDQFLVKNYSSKDATIQGTKPGLVTFSNSAYNTLGQATERIGRFVANLITKKQGEVADAFTPVANLIRNDTKASAELGAFIAVRRRTGENYVFLPEDVAAKYNLTPDTAVLKDALIKDKTGAVVDWNKNYLPEGFQMGQFLTDRAGENTTQGLHNFYNLSPKVAAFERVNQSLNDARIMAQNNWYAANGLQRSTEPGTLYAPPIDTSKYSHFALVKARPGTALSDDGVAVVTAETAGKLQEKLSALSSDYSIYTKDMLRKYHDIQGDYDYNRNFAQSAVNSDLRRRGILNDVFPDTRAETILQNYIDFHSRQTVRQVRDFVELGNSQLFAELNAMGERFTSTETSQTGFMAGLLQKTVENPYRSYINTALNIKQPGNYRLWMDAQEKLEAYASTAFRAARTAFQDAKNGLLPYEEAVNVMQNYGLGNPYMASTNAFKTYYNVANKLPPSPILSRFVATANTIQSATAIRLDTFQSLINIISAPIMTMSEFSSAKSGLRELFSTPLPDGTQRVVPSTTKVLFRAVNNYWNDSVRAQWEPVYKDMGIIRESSSDYFNMIDAMRLPYGPGWQNSKILSKIETMTELGAKITGSQWTENFVRYIAADAARQIFTAAGNTGSNLIDNIGTFVNRIHGNYVASQRPIAFQGPVGQAMSLFQTYQFNLLQQLFRYVENGEAKTLAIGAGLQSTIFGLQGLPGFQIINNHLIGNAANNPGHKDLYGTIPNLLDQKLGDYLLYGVASNWLKAGLYSRGDINPRQISILPINPLDYPAISGGINFLSNLFNTTDKIVKGGALTQSLMLGLEHNGISRPLAGLGQLMQGFTSTSDGQIVSTTRGLTDDNSSGWNDVISFANFGRLLGARPLDEAVAMDATYRKTMYQAKDTTRIEELGAAAKTYLYGKGQIPQNVMNDFATKYAASGGYIPRFGQEIMKWTQEANGSQANQIFKLLSHPINQQMMGIMGGRQLPDYINNNGANSFNATPSLKAPGVE